MNVYKTGAHTNVTAKLQSPLPAPPNRN